MYVLPKAIDQLGIYIANNKEYYSKVYILNM